MEGSGDIKRRKSDRLKLSDAGDISYNCEHLVTTPENVKVTLETFGVAIVPHVLTADECKSMSRRAWQTIRRVTKGVVTYDNPTRFFDLLHPSHSTTLNTGSFGQADYVWDIVRQNVRVVEPFRRIWNVERAEDLLVSFDGIGFCPAPASTDRGYRHNHNWLHVDQRFSDPSFQCVQGWVTSEPVNPGDATLLVSETSHRRFADFAERFDLQTYKKDWFKLLNQDQVDFYKGLPLRAIVCPAGSLVLWDSRTLHQGLEATRESLQFRSIAYVCYTPRSLATPKDLKKKQQAFRDGRTTTHWPHRPKVAGKFPQLYGKPKPDLEEITPYPYEALSDLGKRLAGF